MMLLEADPNKEVQATTNSKAGSKSVSRANSGKATPPIKSTAPPLETPKEENSAGREETKVGDTSVQKKFVPELHIDVQVHISPESSPEQIEQIFASMAKHLKNMM